MKSPFDNNENAFEPMYLDIVQIEGTRPNGTVGIVMKCNVVEHMEGETILDGSTSTERTDIRLMFKWSDIRLVNELQSGDIVTLKNGTRYAISRLDKDFFFGLTATARSCT